MLLKRLKKSLGLITCTILILLGTVHQVGSAQVPGNDPIKLLSSGPAGLEFSVSVPWQSLEYELIEYLGESWTVLELADWQKSAETGAPELPFMAQTIGVPFGVDLEVRVTPGKPHQVQLPAPILPAVDMRVELGLPGFETGELSEPKTIYERIPSPAIYGLDGTYPGIFAEISNDGIMRQQRIAGLSIYPLQYDPQGNVITIYETLTVSVTFSGQAQIESLRLVSDNVIFEELLQDTLLNYDAAQFWRQPLESVSQISADRLATDGVGQVESSPWLPPADAWRISVKEEGMYQLTYAQLIAAGVPLETINPANFQVFTQGREIAIEVIVVAEDQFNVGDLIIFYAEQRESKYSDQNIYWLTVGNTPGLRIGNRSVMPGTADIAPHYQETSHFEENSNPLYYLTKITGDDDLERIMWAGMTYNPTYQTWTYPFSLLTPVTDIPSQLTFSLFGYIDLPQNPDHHVKATLNGTDIGEIYWDGRTSIQWTLNVATGLLQVGANVITLTTPNDIGTIGDVVYIDWVELEFANSFYTEDDSLNFSYESTGLTGFQGNNFSSDEIVVYDVTDPYNTTLLRDTVISGSVSDYTIAFEDDTTVARQYIVSTLTALNNVISITRDIPSNLQSPTNSADYIIITHSTFQDQAETLAAFRNGQGLSTIVVDVQDVYDEFAYGIVGINPIRNFLGYALTQWQSPAPAYVLLVGDGHYDPKNYFNFGRTSFIPPYLAMADLWFGETAVDNRYVTLIGTDTMPDMMIGRLAVNTLDEANAMVNKTINYEANLSAGDWQTHFLAIADKADTAGNFPLISDELVQTQLPSSFQVDKVYYGIAPHVTIAEAKTGIINQINAGAMFVNYIGHGYYAGWSTKNIFAASDVPALNNLTKLPIVLSMTCSDGFFHYPYPYSSNREGLAETFTRSSLGGAVASWSPTGEGLVTGHDRLDRGFLQAYFTDGANTIGEAILAGKLKLWNVGHELELLDLYTLFGDPALNFNRITRAIDDSYAIEENTTLITSSENGVLANDLNPGLLSLTAELVTGTANGVLNLNTDGSFTYSPDADWNGLDEFTYIIFDGDQHSNVATVSIQVNPINYPPIAFDQVIFTLLNQPVEITLTMMDDGVYSGSSRSGFVFDSAATDQLRAITFEIVDQPASGLLDGTAPNMIYTPNDGFLGQDSFTFKVNDGQYDSNVATVIINVTSEIYKIYLPLIVK